ncbi:MAG TPA: LacI family DNA-binding transcriptional regulator [Acidimicrobiales bacterium]|nr:LacI family DNA-binding transcriptional regulator [Acidimicrobiales bacterium]
MTREAPPDIRNVAAAAGVSIATVSRVMSGRGPVSQATRRRVLQAVELLGYSPSASARSLRTTRTQLIGVLVPDLANAVFVPFLRGVQHEAQQAGYSVLVVDAQRSKEIEAAAVERLVELRVEALVLAGRARDPDRLAGLAARGMVVTTAEDEAAGSGGLIVELEDVGTAEMCEALAALGHRHLLYATGSQLPGEAGVWRLASLRQHCERRRLQVSRLVVKRSSDSRTAAALLRAALAPTVGDPPTAVVCATLPLAPTLLAGFAAARLRLPIDCSFVTYGDSPWAAAYQPAISVVALDLYEAAVELTRRTLAEISGSTSFVATRPEPARFLDRASVGPARRP